MDQVVVFPPMLRYSQLFHHPPLACKGIQYTILDCLPRGNVSFTLVNIKWRVRPHLDYSDVKLPANTHPSHIRYHYQWSLLLLLSLVWAACIYSFLCGWGRGIADEVRRITTLLEDPSKVVNFLLKVFLHVDDSIMKTSHHTSLHMGQMLGLEVEILVRVHAFPVDRDI